MNAVEKYVVTPLKERREKRKRDNSEIEKDDASIWVCKTLKIYVIIKKARHFDPDTHLKIGKGCE